MSTSENLDPQLQCVGEVGHAGLGTVSGDNCSAPGLLSSIVCSDPTRRGRPLGRPFGTPCTGGAASGPKGVCV